MISQRVIDMGSCTGGQIPRSNDVLHHYGVWGDVRFLPIWEIEGCLASDQRMVHYICTSQQTIPKPKQRTVDRHFAFSLPPEKNGNKNDSSSTQKMLNHTKDNG